MSTERPEVVWLDGKPWVMGTSVLIGTTLRYRPGGPEYVRQSDLSGPPWPVELIRWPDGTKPEPPAAPVPPVPEDAKRRWTANPVNRGGGLWEVVLRDRDGVATPTGWVSRDRALSLAAQVDGPVPPVPGVEAPTGADHQWLPPAHLNTGRCGYCGVDKDEP